MAPKKNLKNIHFLNDRLKTRQFHLENPAIFFGLKINFYDTEGTPDGSRNTQVYFSCQSFA